MKLKIRDAKRFATVLAFGILMLFVGAWIPADLLALKIALIIAGAVLTWAVVLRARSRFRCPHCQKGYIAPLWTAERFCPCCGQKIEWE